MNMIISKKHIILGTLVVALGAAVYLNYQLSSNELTNTQALESGKNYGQAQLVDGSVSDTGKTEEAYFAEAKLTRNMSRDEAVEAMKTMLSEADLSADNKAQLTLKAADMATAIETEGKMENLIKAKGFEDCMVYYDEESVDVIIKTEGLLDNEAAQIKDIVVEETGLSGEQISIIEVK